MNDALIAILSERENLRKLVDYAITDIDVPPVSENANAESLAKFAYVSCEILCCDVPNMNDLILPWDDGDSGSVVHGGDDDEKDEDATDDTKFGFLAQLFGVLDRGLP